MIFPQEKPTHILKVAINIYEICYNYRYNDSHDIDMPNYPENLKSG